MTVFFLLRLLQIICIWKVGGFYTVILFSTRIKCFWEGLQIATWPSLLSNLFWYSTVRPWMLNHPQAAQYPCSISVPKGSQGTSVLTSGRWRWMLTSGDASASSQEENGVGDFQVCERAGSSAPFLLGLRGLVLSGIRSIYSCETGKQRAFSPASSKA